MSNLFWLTDAQLARLEPFEPPGLPEAIWFEFCGHGWFVQPGVVACFSLGWRYVSDGLQKSSVVEPVDPFQSGEFHSFKAPPWSAPIVNRRRNGALTQFWW